MKAYCINLDRRPDRLEHMVQQFAARGMSFERVAAVDARDPAVAEAALRCGIGMTGKRMSAAAFATFQSHREVWRRVLASGEAHAMVFEDDSRHRAARPRPCKAQFRKGLPAHSARHSPAPLAYTPNRILCSGKNCARHAP